MPPDVVTYRLITISWDVMLVDEFVVITGAITVRDETAAKIGRGECNRMY